MFFLIIVTLIWCMLINDMNLIKACSLEEVQRESQVRGMNWELATFHPALLIVSILLIGLSFFVCFMKKWTLKAK